MSKIIITGGAGMIGSNLVKRLVNEDHEIIVVDNLWRGKLDFLKNENGQYVICLDSNFHAIDLSYQGSIDHLIGDTDYIIHLADIVAGIDYVFGNQSFIFRHNLLINSNVINSLKKSRVKGFIYVGTACSFPETLQNNFKAKLLKEEDLYPAQPESSYGWSKLMGQYETTLLEKEFGIQTVSLMLHNVYGAPCDYSPERSQVIPALLRKAINYPDEEYIVWGSGKQGRAFIHVDDVVNAIVLALDKGWSENRIQIGPSTCTTIKEIAEEVIRISGKKIEIKYDLSKPEGDKSRAADYSLANKVLGWRPTVALNDGLTRQYGWMAKKMKNNI